jgi:hypothetical protein
MSVIRDDCEERQTRVDRMIDEFRAAQLRRVVQAAAARPDDRPALQPDTDAQAAVVPTTTRRTP